MDDRHTQSDTDGLSAADFIADEAQEANQKGRPAWLTAMIEKCFRENRSPADRKAAFARALLAYDGSSGSVALSMFRQGCGRVMDGYASGIRNRCKNNTTDAPENPLSYDPKPCPRGAQAIYNAGRASAGSANYFDMPMSDDRAWGEWTGVELEKLSHNEFRRAAGVLKTAYVNNRVGCAVKEDTPSQHKEKATKIIRTVVPKDIASQPFMALLPTKARRDVMKEVKSDLKQRT